MTLSTLTKDTGLQLGDSSSFTFSFSPMVIFLASEIEVYHVVVATGVETLLTEGTGASNYSVSTIASTGATGNVTYPADTSTPIPSTEAILIKRKLAQTQSVPFANQGGYFPKTIERIFDRMTMMIQAVQEEVDRCLKLPITHEAAFVSTEIAPDALRGASKFLKVNSAGTGFDVAAVATTDGSASDVTPQAVNVSAGASGSGADYARDDHVHLLPTTVPRLATENVFTESQVWKKGTDVTATSTLSLGAGNFFDITGATTITSITGIGVGTLIILHFDAALILTHHDTNLVLPGARDFITQAGDELMFYEFASADWRLVSYSGVAPNLIQGLDLAQKVTFFDDFIGTISTPISSTKGGGSGTEVATISAGAGGRVTLKSSTADGNNAANTSTLTLDTLDWTADMGGLAMEVRLAIDDVSEAALFVGFTDAISTTLNLPVFKASGTNNLDSDASNACGVGYDVDGTTDEFWHGGVKANTDTAAVHSGSAPTDNTKVTIRVEVTAAGIVRGFINGAPIGAATSAAITAGTSITPCVMISNRSANQVIATIDYLWCQADRT